MSKNKIRKFLYGLAGAIFLCGTCAILYPYVSDYINEIHTSKMYEEYVEMVNSMDTEVIEAMLEDARKFNKSLTVNSTRWLPDGIDLELYNSILDTTGTGIICYVEVPKIGVRLPVYHGTSDTVLQIAVGHMEGSSFPIGEKGTHAVLSGHNGLISAEIFTELNKVEVGDEFYVTILGKQLVYEVVEVNVVLPSDFNYFEISPEHDWVTLVTCTPFGVNSHRLLVKGERIEDAVDE